MANFAGCGVQHRGHAAQSRVRNLVTCRLLIHLWKSTTVYLARVVSLVYVIAPSLLS